jgi:hypothetical protein
MLLAYLRACNLAIATLIFELVRSRIENRKSKIENSKTAEEKKPPPPLLDGWTDYLNGGRGSEEHNNICGDHQTHY